MVGTPANMLFPSERDSAKSSSKPPPRARFLRDRNARLIARGQQAPQRHQTGQGRPSQHEATGPQTSSTYGSCPRLKTRMSGHQTHPEHSPASLWACWGPVGKCVSTQTPPTPSEIRGWERRPHSRLCSKAPRGLPKALLPSTGVPRAVWTPSGFSCQQLQCQVREEGRWPPATGCTHLIKNFKSQRML